jgi:hypothetical protein
VNLLKKLSSLFGAASRARDEGYAFAVRCDRCGEIIQGRVNLSNDLSLSDDAGAASYFCRKVLIGSGRCFQPIEVRLAFDADRRLTSQEIVGGKFVKD